MIGVCGVVENVRPHRHGLWSGSGNPSVDLHHSENEEEFAIRCGGASTRGKSGAVSPGLLHLLIKTSQLGTANA